MEGNAQHVLVRERFLKGKNYRNNSQRDKRRRKTSPERRRRFRQKWRCNGDLYINIKIETKTKIHFDKLNIFYNVPITPFEAALGEEITIPTFDGKIKLKLPKNTCSGQKFRIAKQGIKKNGKIGDLIVSVSIEFSHDLSEDEIKLYEKLKNLSTDDVRKNLRNEC